ncbi:hypothetical protein DRO42_03195 [Candidatus Bathyarchaeota archaeon]|nr:MAG: hypothetical protein DRO42_03195 [Candidatus Bathyarchaeota archaeon]
MFRKSLAQFVSAAMNAPLIAFVTFIPLILSQGASSAPTLIAITTLFGSVLPLASTFYMVRKGIIPDVYASDRRTRVKPFIVAMGSYLMGVAALLAVGAPRGVTALMACYAVNSLILLVITTVWKISIHASGVTGPVTALVFELGARMAPLFLLALPVAWARIELKAHNLKQVAAGALLTSWLTWLQMNLYVNYLFI